MDVSLIIHIVFLYLVEGKGIIYHPLLYFDVIATDLSELRLMHEKRNILKYCLANFHKF